MNRHNLQLARHASTDMSAIGLGNDCLHFKLSDTPRVAGLICGGQGENIMNATLRCHC